MKTRYIFGRFLRITWCVFVVWLLTQHWGIKTGREWVETNLWSWLFVPVTFMYMVYPVYCCGWAFVCIYNIFRGPNKFNTPTPLPLYFLKQLMYGSANTEAVSITGYSNIDAMIDFRNSALSKGTYDDVANDITRHTQVLDAAVSGALPSDHMEYLNGKFSTMTFEDKMDWLRGE